MTTTNLSPSAQGRQAPTRCPLCENRGWLSPNRAAGEVEAQRCACRKPPKAVIPAYTPAKQDSSKVISFSRATQRPPTADAQFFKVLEWLGEAGEAGLSTKELYSRGVMRPGARIAELRKAGALILRSWDEGKIARYYLVKAPAGITPPTELTKSQSQPSLFGGQR